VAREDESDDDEGVARDGTGTQTQYDIESDLDSDYHPPSPTPVQEEECNGNEVVAEAYPARAVLDRGREPGPDSEYRSTTPMSPAPVKTR
jgi:hypothetical protein